MKEITSLRRRNSLNSDDHRGRTGLKLLLPVKRSFGRWPAIREVLLP